ncbi:hypothetical protein JYT83_01555, partial [bacterium AH-315-F18]|nr:hypothetical protein [bacterium AH-315-F18]
GVKFSLLIGLLATGMGVWLCGGGSYHTVVAIRLPQAQAMLTPITLLGLFYFLGCVLMCCWIFSYQAREENLLRFPGT